MTPKAFLEAPRQVTQIARFCVICPDIVGVVHDCLIGLPQHFVFRSRSHGRATHRNNQQRRSPRFRDKASASLGSIWSARSNNTRA